MPAVSEQIEAQGHTITKKWWEVEEVGENGVDPDRDAKLREQAKGDVAGVLAADLVLVVNSSKSEGKAFEQGLAVANNKPIVIVGKRGEFSANVFHYLQIYHWVETVEEALKVLATIKWLMKEG